MATSNRTYKSPNKTRDSSVAGPGSDSKRDAWRVSYGPLSIDVSSLSVEISGKKAKLQPLQRRMLLYMLCNLHRAISRQEFLSNVWEAHHETGSSNVRRQIHGLRRGLGSAGALIETSARMGWGIGLLEAPDGSQAESHAQRIAFDRDPVPGTIRTDAAAHRADAAEPL
jgi:DNA-binding response OmpR family regulator